MEQALGDAGTRDLMFRGEISGLDANTQLGFHIHKAAFDGLDCSSTEGHFNPQEVDHGAWFDDLEGRHVGDLKQLWTNWAGEASYRYQDNQASLYEDDEKLDFDHYVGGLAIVIHAGMDDEGNGGDAGSIASGNAGPRLACCNIEIIEEADYEKLYFRDY